MTYDFLVVLPVVAVGVFCGVGALVASGRARALLTMAALLSAYLPAYSGFLGSGSSLGVGPAFYRVGQRIDELRHHAGVDRAAALAEIQWLAHDYAGSYLPWALVPLVLGVIGIVRCRSRSRVGFTAFMVAASAPVVFFVAVLLVAWLRPMVVGTWHLDDPRWALDYAEESLAFVRPPELDQLDPGPAPMQLSEARCEQLHNVLREPGPRARLTGLVGTSRVADAERRCSVDGVFRALEARIHRFGTRGDACSALDRLLTRSRAEDHELARRHHAGLSPLLERCGRPVPWCKRPRRSVQI